MTPTAQAGTRLRWCGSSMFVAVLGVIPAGARADLWVVDNSVQTRFELNDNVSLSSKSPGAVKSLSLSNSLNASRQMENSATRLSLALTGLSQRGNGGQDRVDGKLGVSQTFSDPLNTFGINADYSQDFNNTVQGADVTVNPGQRRTGSLSASWSRAITERLSAGAQASASRTSYGRQATVATDFGNTDLSVNLSYRLTEIDTLSLRGGHSEYRVTGGSNQSKTNDISFGLSRVLSERVTASLSLGAYRTERSQPRSRIACPLQLALCNAGLVPFIVVQEQVKSADLGLQYDSGYRYQINETSSVSFSSGSQQTPTGAGEVTRGQTLNLEAAHAFSETFNASVGYAVVRSKYQGSRLGGTAKRQSFTVSASKQVAPDLSLSFGYQWTEAVNAGVSSTARSNSAYVSLQYDWSKIDLTR